MKAFALTQISLLISNTGNAIWARSTQREAEVWLERQFMRVAAARGLQATTSGDGEETLGLPVRVYTLRDLKDEVYGFAWWLVTEMCNNGWHPISVSDCYTPAGSIATRYYLRLAVSVPRFPGLSDVPVEWGSSQLVTRAGPYAAGQRAADGVRTLGHLLNIDGSEDDAPNMVDRLRWMVDDDEVDEEGER